MNWLIDLFVKHYSLILGISLGGMVIFEAQTLRQISALLAGIAIVSGIEGRKGA